ncbi:triose-phosphate isomerase [Aureibacter tunicatorum]|uniref:Triosephosphate isomerase n=1 Tax=Aureibacter tunicatorum TaxID=866807 RepID=A0AAE3XKI7_9BACT|nr:triose-phosphate isomerase [Aureibacter tunicatorum]MDR6237615.1 triosephosphate isomerase [Aureibacter tunicatorum]BDD02650.1 triosephosphate isomerase [Aureibacter tunicatorum]
MRDKIVAGNWKMHKTLEEGKILASEVVNIVTDEVNSDAKVILGTPFVHLDSVSKLIKDSANVFIAAQNCSEHEQGAYTGEISAAMLASMGVDYVILGHSERREYFNESNEQLAAKVDKVYEHGMIPIFCCGEALDIREAGTEVDFVCQQLTESIFHLSNEQFEKIVIAYEPIWAIGTGRTASSEQAQEMHDAIRKHLASKYGQEIADKVSILYGGSCKPSNAKEIFAGKDVDGGLIGGASLVARDFVDIVKSF